MLGLNDFVLLKAIFDEKLSDAVLAKDADEIKVIITNEYDFEWENGFIKFEEIDVEKNYEKHLEEINDTELWKRLI